MPKTLPSPSLPLTRLFLVSISSTFPKAGDRASEANLGQGESFLGRVFPGGGYLSDAGAPRGGPGAFVAAF
jgi:hypothetical protein